MAVEENEEKSADDGSREDIVMEVIQEDGEVVEQKKMGIIESIRNYPPGIKYIIGNEACERFSFYGLKAILALFLSDSLFYSQNTSTMIIHSFIFLAYLSSVPGGYLADTHFGKFKTIIYVGVLYVIGTICLSAFAVPDVVTAVTVGGDPYFLGRLGNAISLLLIAFGTGDQFGPHQTHLMEYAFSLFYFSINAGSLLSTIITPELRANFSPWVAFALPAVLLTIAMFIFWLGRKSYVMVPPNGSVIAEAMQVLKAGLPGLTKGSFWQMAREKFDFQTVEDVRITVNVLVVFLPLPIFWAIFDQHSSRWIFQAQQMYLPEVLGWKMQPDQIPTLNPLFTLSLLPIFSALLYPFCKRFGLLIKPLQHRMFTGMLIASMTFAVAALLQFWIDISPPNSINIAFQVPQYFLLSCAEIMVSVTGLEFAYSEAPKSMKSLVMAGWLMTTAFGNLIVAFLAELDWPSDMYWNFIFYSLLMLIFDVIFLAQNWSYVYRHERLAAEAIPISASVSLSSSSSSSALDIDGNALENHDNPSNTSHRNGKLYGSLD